MKTVMQIIEKRGGLEALKAQAIKIEHEGYMRLCIESVGVGPRGLPAVSVAHYYEMNGDLVADPDMVFEVANGEMFPVSFQQGALGIYQEAVFKNEAGQVMAAPRLQADLARFARLWSKNLKAQGFLAVA